MILPSDVTCWMWHALFRMRVGSASQGADRGLSLVPEPRQGMNGIV